MAPNKSTIVADDDAAKKRKRDKAEDREERQARKKHKSKSKSHPKANASQGGNVQPHKPASNKAESLEPGAAQFLVLAQPNGGSNGLEMAKRRVSPAGEEPSESWKVSKPMGGRMLDIDPVFSADEEHLLIAYNTSIQVYSTADSLLVRRIPLAVSDVEEADKTLGVHIVSMALSKVSANLVWVASSDGRIWCLDWTNGSGAKVPFTIEVKKVLDMTINEVQIGQTLEDVLLILEKTSHSGGQIVAYDRKALTARSGRPLHTCDDNPHILRSAGSSSVIVVATKNSVHIGLPKHKAKDVKALGSLQYQFFSFDLDDQITTFDLRLPVQSKKNSSRPTVDLTVGCARGTILVFTDVLAKFPSGAGATPRKGSLQPRTLHWHSKAVHGVKWSQDGNYLISGGSEGVLVLWQLDTGKKDFLPHLSASIENIVVSPRGSSYAVHLDDNSTMVLSTAEMKPSTYVSGIQSLSFSDKRTKDSLVRRVWQEPDEISTSIPAVSNPTNPAQILVSTGNGQKSTLAEGNALSAPYLQIFDIESSQSVAKQAVARANPTDSRVTTKGYPIVEPTVTQVAFSHNGKWLATVDEWQPPERDVDNLLDGSKSVADICNERREIYLKFWETGQNGSSFQLVSRINEAHYTMKPEPVFDLASDPSSTRFATVGGDGIVRLWSPKLRQTDGLAATGPEGENLWRWSCTQSIHLERTIDQDSGIDGFQTVGNASGALDFSEDGSTLFVAYGGSAEAVVYIIDTDSGEIRDRLFNMFNGDVKELKAISSCLVMLSDDLRVYNVVSDELHYGIGLKKMFRGPLPLLQLAVSSQSRSFALAVPLLRSGENAKRGTVSELVIFSIDDNQPQLVQTFPHLITSLISTKSSSGFIVVDSAAQVWSVGIGAESSMLAQPLADIQLDKEVSAADEGIPLRLTDGDDDAASDEEMQDLDADEEAEDYDIHPAVIAPQRLAEIFNAGPAFAMPSIEDIFYQVAELLNSKPIASSAA